MCGVTNGRVGVAEDDGVVQVRPADHPKAKTSAGKNNWWGRRMPARPDLQRATVMVSLPPWDAPVSSDSIANSDNGDEDIILAERAGRKT